MKPKMFVIMPMHDKAVAESKISVINQMKTLHGWDVFLPRYDRQNPSFDLSNIIDEVADCAVVFADLTGERPSCYFELGVAETLSKPIVIAAEIETDIHQTSYRDKVNFFAGLDQFQILVSATMLEYQKAMAS